jgi:Flp pilus assembly protein TadD
MIRSALIVLISLLGACASLDTSQLGSGMPGLNVASAALAGGSPEIALRVTDGILAKDPNNVPALLTQGDALSALGRPREARESYMKALIADPKSAMAQMEVGRLDLRTDPAHAQVLFLQALQHDPSNKTALNDLGIAYDLQGDHASAQAAYRKALGTDSTMRAAEVNLALSMALNGQAPEAVRLLQPIANDPNATRRVRDDFAAALAITGDKVAAAKILSANMTPEQTDRAVQAFEEFGQ